MSYEHLHFTSSTVGSIGEISSQLENPLSNNFTLTLERRQEFPKKKELLLCHFIDLQVVNHKMFNKFKKKILIQPIDGTSIEKKYIEAFNKFDLIIVPALASKLILIKNNVTVPIEIIPNYFQNNLFEKKITTPIEKYLPTDKIIFYHESTFHPRKGIELMYEGFIKAFSNNKSHKEVLLVLKDSPINKNNYKELEELKKQAISLQRKYKYKANIIKFSAHLDIDDLKTLWNRCNAYVNLAKIEGFGIPMLRHFLLNKPILCLENNNSGYNDYLKNNCYKIPSFQTIARNEIMDIYDENTKWAVPKIDDVVDYFRKLKEDILLDRSISINLNSEYKQECLKKYEDECIFNSYIHLLKNI